MTNEELLSIIDRERANSIGFTDGKLASDRRKAMDYYLGHQFGNETEGLSKYVSRDVMETVEWIMPVLMKMFASTDDIVRFDPVGPEDVQSAQQATDYTNYVFTKQNNGFVILYTFFKDALLQKNGFVKVYWDEYETRKIEEYENLTLDDANLIIQSNQILGLDTEVLGKEQDDETGLLSVKFSVTNKVGKVCVDPIPPEEIRISKSAGNDIQKARYVAHERGMSASELREMGISTDGLESDNTVDWNQEKLTRFADDQEDVLFDDATSEATRQYLVTESYILVDYDGDGIAERRHVLTCGNKILAGEDGEINEEIDSVPIETTTPILMPHKLFGLSVADLVMDLQLLKSSLTRQILNNLYLTNNPRKAVLDGMANVDDLLTVRPGGIVRVKTFDAVKDLTVPFFGAPAFNMLSYIDAQRDNRTGVRAFQGVDADVLTKNVAGVAIDKATQAAQIKIELIARIFAETGVKNVMWRIMKLIQQNETKPRVMRLRNTFVQVDPQEWSTKFDMSVNVGLGTGNKDQILQGSQLLAQAQQQMALNGLMNRTVSEQNIYNLWKEVAEVIFPKKSDQFFSNPQTMPPPQPPSPDPKVQLGKYKADLMDKTKRDLAAANFLIQAKQMHQQTMMDQAEMQQEDAHKAVDFISEMTGNAVKAQPNLPSTRKGKKAVQASTVDQSNPDLADLKAKMDTLISKQPQPQPLTVNVTMPKGGGKRTINLTPQRDAEGNLIGAQATSEDQ